jgi:hypothetical protein
VRVAGELALPDGRVERPTREFAVEDEVTVLFEVARLGEEPLTLAIRAEATAERVVVPAVSALAPILLNLEILRVEGGQTILLESNRLQTFVGEPVSYAFHVGDTAAEVKLTPSRVAGEMVDLGIEVLGMLPGTDGPVVVGRREQWLTNRGATSSLSIEAGQPPVGYRFRVTPSF